jgi:DnaJ-class molecular chaperone
VRLLKESTREGNFRSDPVPTHPRSLPRQMGDGTRVCPTVHGRRHITAGQLIRRTTNEGISKGISITVVDRGTSASNGVPLAGRLPATNLT